MSEAAAATPKIIASQKAASLPRAAVQRGSGRHGVPSLAMGWSRR